MEETETKSDAEVMLENWLTYMIAFSDDDITLDYLTSEVYRYLSQMNAPEWLVTKAIENIKIVYDGSKFEYHRFLMNYASICQEYALSKAMGVTVH